MTFEQRSFSLIFDIRSKTRTPWLRELRMSASKGNFSPVPSQVSISNVSQTRSTCFASAPRQIDWECIQALGGDPVCRFLEREQQEGEKQRPVGWSAMELWKVIRIGTRLFCQCTAVHARSPNACLRRTGVRRLRERNAMSALRVFQCSIELELYGERSAVMRAGAGRGWEPLGT